MGDISELLDRARGGDKSAQEGLLPLVYDELRRIAAARIRHQPPGSTLNPTALVHEAYMRLAPKGDMPGWNSRGHFFSAASEAMRRVLIDAARRRIAAKRGSEFHKIDWSAAQPATVTDERLLAIDEALERLAESRPQVAHLVKLKFFAGLTFSEAAEILDVSERTAKNWWTYARAWMHAELGDL